jgi:hypothetical protein
MGRFVKLLAVLGVLAVLGYFADRYVEHVAEGKIATVVQADAHLSARPAVKVHGFPFLTQLIRGKYHDVEVRGDDVFQHGTPGGATLRLDFFGAAIPLSKALKGSVTRVPVDHVTGSMTVPYDDLEATATAAGIVGVTRLAAVPGVADTVAFSEQAVVAGPLGTSVSLTAQVTAKVVFTGGSLVVTATGVQVVGRTLPAAATASVLSHATFSVPLPGLPAGVHVTALTVQPTGLAVTVGSGPLVLSR